MLWAGPESLAGARRGHAVEGTVRSGPVSLRMGIGGLGGGPGYLVDLGLPVQSKYTAFNRDPEIKREAVWSGPVMRPSTLVARRKQSAVEYREESGARTSQWHRASVSVDRWRSMLTEWVDPGVARELWEVREALRGWRFHDGFRTDAGAPARQPRPGTRSLVLADDGSNLAACLQTIVEHDESLLAAAISDAFPGSRLEVISTDGLFDVVLHQPGMLRGIRSAELSDGTLRYLLWLATVLTPAPPRLMALNEPETSLHPSLVPALGRAMARASQDVQIVVVTHSAVLLRTLEEELGQVAGTGPELSSLQRVDLWKDHGETMVRDQGLLSRPVWEWGRR